MAEMDNVITTETIEADWGNDIRDRTVQRYDDASTRDSENGSPTAGDLAYLQDTGDLQVYHDSAWANLVPTGALFMWVTNTAPDGYLLCQGQAVSRTTYSDLFAVMSTTYGNGNGSTTFNLPDMRQAFPMGKAASGTGNSLGDEGGSINHNHSVDPPNTSTTTNGDHTHEVGAAEAGSGGVQFDSAENLNPHDHGTTSTDGDHSHNVNIASFNSGNANPPYVVVNFIVKI